MGLGQLVAIMIRSVFAPIILKLPLLGGILAIVLDYYDLNIISYLNHGNLDNYQLIDKVLDEYYLSLEAYVAVRWTNRLARFAAIILFTVRLLGFVIFLFSRNAIFLVIFPNVFEFFFLFYLVFKVIFKKDPITSIPRLLIIIVMLTIPKIIHEYFLHVNTTYPWTENKYFKVFTSASFNFLTLLFPRLNLNKL